MPMLNEILFTDIETVTQYKKFSEVPEAFQKLWARQVRQSYKDLLEPGTDVDHISTEQLACFYHNKGSLHAEFSKIVCATVGKFVFENGDTQPPTLKVKAITGDEKAILNTISGALGKVKAACGHNGKKFDFPFFARRCMINGLPVPQVLDVRNVKPWDVTNIDTQDLWRFGDMVFPSLALMCTVLGIPVNTDFDGGMVHDAFYNGELDKVVAHCNDDVIALAKLYVKIISGLDVTNVVVL